MPDALATPIHLAPAHRDLVPHRYILHVHTQHCRCGTLHEHSELYAKTHLRSRTGHTYFSNLRPIHTLDEIAYNLPIDTIRLEPKRILFCSQCIGSASLSHLPPPPKPTPEPTAAADLRRSDLIRNSPTDEKPKQHPKRDSKPFTIDDL